MARLALVWNFEDDNFTWMDASVIIGIDSDMQQLSDVTCMRYGFAPGWVVRYQGELDQGVTYDDFMGGTDPWGPGNRATRYSDLYSAGKDQNFYWASKEGIWLSDQVVDTSGVKSYYAERTGIDFTEQGLATSDSYRHVSRIYPLLQSSNVGTGNTYSFTIGWGANLMDPPDYSDAREINLNTSDYAGKHKIDLRETGRYMAWRFDFTYTGELNMTGADIELEVVYGR